MCFAEINALEKQCGDKLILGQNFSQLELFIVSVSVFFSPVSLNYTLISDKVFTVHIHLQEGEKEVLSDPII